MTSGCDDPMFQPMREYLERVCVLRDWGEVVVATNLVSSRCCSAVLYRALTDLGNAHSDSVLPHFAYSVYGDEERHWSWAAALAAMLNEESDENLATTAEWIDSWTPLALRSVEALAPVFSVVGNEPVLRGVHGGGPEPRSRRAGRSRSHRRRASAAPARAWR